MASKEIRLFRIFKSLLAGGLLALSLLHAQEYSFKNYSSEEGLLNTNINTLFQDHEGFLWIGTDTRLYRFDGRHFEEYAWDAGLPQTNVNSLAEDSFGHLWVGTESGLFFLSNGKLRSILDQGQSIRTLISSRIVRGPGRSMYVAQSSSILRLFPDGNGQNWTAQEAVPAAALKNASILTIQSLQVNAHDDLFFGCDDALCRWSKGQLLKWKSPTDLPKDQWKSLLLSRSGDLWMQGIEHVAVLPSGQTRFVVHDLPRSIRNISQPLLVEDASHQILVAVGASIARWEQDHWRLFTESNGLPSAVTTLLVDAEGSVWLGGVGHGLYKWLGYGSWENWTKKQGLGSNVVWAICRDSHHELWVGHDAGVSIWDAHQGQFITVPMPAKMLNDRIQTLVVAGKTLLAGSLLGHLALVNTETRRAEQIPLEAGSIIRMRTSGDGKVWIAADQGLYVFDPATRQPVRITSSLFGSNRFHDVSILPDGTVYALSESGLYRYNRGSWVKINCPTLWMGGQYSEFAISPHDGAIWLDGPFPGIGRLKLNGTSVVDQQTLWRSAIQVSDVLLVDRDRQNRLWLGGPNGLSVFNGSAWRPITREDGLAWDDLNSKAFFADQDGTLWFGTSQGLSHLVRPNFFDRCKLPLQLRLTNARFGSQTLLEGEEVRFKWQKAPLTINLLPLSLHNTKTAHVRYRLMGFDRDWLNTRESEISYSQLDPGSYRFEAVAIDLTFGRQSKPLVLQFQIDPPWWRSWWFSLLVLGSLYSIIWCAVRWRTKLLFRRQKELEELVAVRTQELAAKKQEAEHASLAKSRFLAMMSHEIRTPLAAVIGIADLLRSTSLSADQLDFVATIQSSGQGLLSIINDILDFSKIEAGKMELNPVPFEPARMLTDCEFLVRHAAESKLLKLSCVIEKDVPQWLLGDGLRLRQVVLNLLANAVKFTGENGSVSLHICSERTSTGKDVLLHVEVIDTGVGIAIDQQSRLFQSFSQADESTTRKFGGTGLGLAISKQLIDLMGGEIGLTSEPGVGSTFWFRVPLLLAQGPAQTGEGAIALQVQTERRRALSGRRVLVAEDNPVNQKVARSMLQKAGCEVLIASNGKEAVAMAEAHELDLILMDCQMPEMDGLEATAAIRTGGGRSAGVPIIAATANVLEGERAKCLTAGMSDYLPKPITQELLAQKLSEWLLPAKLAEQEEVPT